VFAPDALGVFWFCSMSITTSAPLLAAFWLCVIEAVALTVEVSVWFCPSALLFVSQAAVVPESTAAFSALFGPLDESCVMFTDWEASSVVVTGFPFRPVVEPSKLMFCVTQAVFPCDAPVAVCVITAVKDNDVVSPATFWLFSQTTAVFGPEPDWMIVQDCPDPVGEPEPFFKQTPELPPLLGAAVEASRRPEA